MGLGYERIFDDHKHQTIGIVGTYRPVNLLSINVSPGLTFENNDASELRFALHLESSYEFELGNFHLGPVLEFAYDPHQSYGLIKSIAPHDEDWAHYWHSTSRFVGYHFLNPEIDTVLFLDVDEIPDGDRFNTWLNTFSYKDYNALRLYSYFYYRSPSTRAISWPGYVLMIKRHALQSEDLLTIYEREGIFHDMLGPKMTHVAGADGLPLIHHYGWVRTKEELIHKVQRCGHHYERDWVGAIESGEPIFDLKYEEVEAIHDPLSIEVRAEESTFFTNVQKVDARGINKLLVRQMV